MLYMNDKPQSIGTKSRTGPRVTLVFLLILALIALSAAIMLAANAVYGEPIWERVPLSKTALFGLVGVTALAVALLLFALLIPGGLYQRLVNLRMAGRGLFGLACLATLIALFYAEENWRGRRAWDHYVSQQAAKGEELDLAALIPPPIPDDKNFALCPLLKPILNCENKTITESGGRKVPPFIQRVWLDTKGWEHIRRLSPYGLGDQFKQSPSGKKRKVEVEDARKELEKNPLTNGWINLAAWQSYYRAITNLDGTVSNGLPATDVLRALDYADADLAELKREASQRPLGRWPIPYNLNCPWETILPHLATQKAITQVLQLRAAAYLASGSAERSISDIELGFRLADSSRNEPFLISHLVRLACYDLLLQPLKEGLARRQFSDAQLTRVQDKLQTLDLLSSYQCAMRGERSVHGRWVAVTVQEFEGLIRFVTDQRLRFFSLFLRIAPQGWIYQNQLAICRRYDGFHLPIVDVRARTVHPDLAQAIPSAAEKAKGPYSILLYALSLIEDSGLLEQAPSWSRRFAFCQTQVDQAFIACALERYRLARGQFPETLDALAPQFMAKLPHDVINGQPLHYQRTADGQFTLYSVGWNQKDDNGTLVLDKDGKVDQEQGDWVWQQPGK
jgi:hypothetical protein